MSKRSNRTEEVWVEPGCNLACAVCDCRIARSATLERTLAGGGGRLEIRGEAANMRELADVVARAHAAGWARVAVRTNATGFTRDDRARALRDTGVDEVVFFLASDRPQMHDAITRVRGAHAAALRGARVLSGLGLAMSVEIPILATTVQDLAGTLEQACEATLAKRARLYSPGTLGDFAGPPPRELLPPRWADVRPAVAAAITRAEALGIEVAFAERDGVPLCGVLRDGEARAILPERDQRPIVRGASSQLGTRCTTCAVNSACPGVTDTYLRVHGDGGLEPRTSPRRDFVRERVRPDAIWTDERRASARERSMVVLRPTVDCNQDCWFCSANETSQNVERDAARMSRKILRLARGGVRHLSFSGGEPTLSRHLVEHVALAHAAGIVAVELVTNAVLLDREEIVDAYAGAGLTNLFVSLHGHDEATSRAQTRKRGDHARTTRALHLFAERTSVVIRLNHVITMRNYRALVRFVEWTTEQFGTRVSISFAFLTPQYKALERLGEVLPSYREVVPYLQKALARASELGIECVVGSRQGVPPCVLGDFAIFSDVAAISENALAEDTAQKTKKPSCSTCRFDRLCTGVWSSYARVHGVDELVPVPGEAIEAHQDLGAALGVRALPASSELVVAPEPRARRSLDVLADTPLRVALVGTGARARRILRAASEASIQIVAVTSPHVLEKDLPELGRGVTRTRSVEEALDGVDAVIIASTTADHATSARLALARALPVLVEKPLAGTAAEAMALAVEGSSRIAVAHQTRMAAGFQELVTAASGLEKFEIRIHKSIAETSPDAIVTWNRAQLYENLIHLLDLAVAFHGSELVVARARAVGEIVPESFEVRGERFVIACETLGGEDLLEVELSAPSLRMVWQRRGADEEIVTHDALGARTRNPQRGSDLSRLLAAWAASIQSGRAPPITAAEGVAAMRLASDVLRKLEESGTRFDRASAPRHASSRDLRERYE